MVYRSTAPASGQLRHGGCELKVKEFVHKKQGPVNVTIENQTNGVRVIVNASADNSVDYKLLGKDSYFIEGGTIYKADFSVFWTPRENCVDFNPDTAKVFQHTDRFSLNLGVESNGIVLVALNQEIKQRKH